jgi:hypothetical protein
MNVRVLVEMQFISLAYKPKRLPLIYSAHYSKHKLLLGWYKHFITTFCFYDLSLLQSYLRIILPPPNPLLVTQRLHVNLKAFCTRGIGE